MNLKMAAENLQILSMYQVLPNAHQQVLIYVQSAEWWSDSNH